MNDTILQSNHLTGDNEDVLRLVDIDSIPLKKLLARYGLELKIVESGKEVPGSFWGDEEAGLIGNALLVRNDTPLHSILHEACHYVCMDQQRRAGLDTDAGGDYDEENGVCYLQVLLSDQLEQLGRERMLRDMDLWGYTFRFGSAQAWFETDADDARAYLFERGLIDASGIPTFRLSQ